MAVDRLSVTVPSELGAALRALADARGRTVSALVTDAIADELRRAALDQAVAAAKRGFGPVSEELFAEARRELPTAGRKSRQAAEAGVSRIVLDAGAFLAFERGDHLRETNNKKGDKLD